MWRKGGYKEYSNKILSSSPTASLSQADFSQIVPKIVKTEVKKVYYIRHRGYNKGVLEIWQKIMSWVYTNEVEDFEQIGIYYDNPIITPLDDCFYVAGIMVNKEKEFPNSSLQSFELPQGLYAQFHVEGKYGDILKLIQWAYHHWLPNSGYETTPNPSYTIFEKNHYLEKDGVFRVKYYVPVRFV
jgi:AraC family transcriptional regulator